LSAPRDGFVRIEKTSHYLQISPWWKNFLSAWGISVMTETVTYDIPAHQFEEELP
jgi:hypothetical protein